MPNRGDSWRPTKGAVRRNRTWPSPSASEGPQCAGVAGRAKHIELADLGRTVLRLGHGSGFVRSEVLAELGHDGITGGQPLTGLRLLPPSKPGTAWTSPPCTGAARRPQRCSVAPHRRERRRCAAGGAGGADLAHWRGRHPAQHRIAAAERRGLRIALHPHLHHVT